MKKVSIYFLVLIGIVMFSCNSENDDSDPQSDDKIVLQFEDLDSRVHIDNAGVVAKQSMPSMPDNFDGTDSDVTKSTTIDDSDVASDLPLILVAEVDAPQYDNLVLQATHVCFSGNYAYVSYNVQGERYLGAVEAIDITDPALPRVVSHATFPSMDISSLTIKDGILYLVGARDVDAYEGVTKPAVLVKMALSDGLLSDNIDFIELSSYVGTDVVAGDSHYYCVSGNTGALSAFSISDGALASQIDQEDLRAVGIDGNKLVTLSGTQGIHVYNIGSMSETQSFSVSSDVVEAKRTIDFYNGHVLVAEGYDGMGAYQLSNGTQTLAIPVAEASGSNIDVNDIVCNAVTVSDGHIFMAEGAAGVIVYSIATNGLDNPVEIGGLNLEGSANYVKSGSDYVFVADGTGGLKILKIVSDGESDNNNPAYACSTYPAYTGQSWFNVNSNDNQAYRGSSSLGGINVGAQLIWCGSLAVSSHINVNSGGEFAMIGSLVVGGGYGDVLNINSKMIVEGSLVIYGNLNINSGGSLEFVGANSAVYVSGTVRVNSGGEITGSYTDQSGNVKQ